MIFQSCSKGNNTGWDKCGMWLCVLNHLPQTSTHPCMFLLTKKDTDYISIIDMCSISDVILVVINISKMELSRVENAWNVTMYNIYRLSGDTPKSAYVFTKWLPICTKLLLRQITFLKSCAKMDNMLIHHVFVLVNWNCWNALLLLV